MLPTRPAGVRDVMRFGGQTRRMSPVSRGRKGKRKNKSTRRSALPFVLSAPDECDCPSCSGADFDPQRVIDEMIVAAADLTESEDPLDAELVGATVMSIGAGAGESFEEALIGGSSRSSRLEPTRRRWRCCCPPTPAPDWFESADAAPNTSVSAECSSYARHSTCSGRSPTRTRRRAALADITTFDPLLLCRLGTAR
jgi:hypothetical protein